MLRHSASRCRSLARVMSVDDGIPRDVNAIRGDALRQQVIAGPLPRCAGRRHPPVELLRPGRLKIARPQPGLHVHERHVPVKGRNRSRQDRRRIPLNHDAVGSDFGQSLVQLANTPGGQRGQGLVALHELQMAIRLDLEIARDPFEHLAMLAGGGHDQVDGGLALHALADDWRQLNSLGSRAKYDEWAES